MRRSAKYPLLILAAFFSLATSLASPIQAHPDYQIIAVARSTPTIDGIISPGEWIDTSNVTFNGTTVLLKQDGVNLYIAFNVTDNTQSEYDECGIAFDVYHDGSGTLQTDDIGFSVTRNGTIYELNVTMGVWNPHFQISEWTTHASSMGNVWQSEFNITYPELNITAGTAKTLGVFFSSLDLDLETSYGWPLPPANPYSPDTWGDITSSGYNWVPEFSNVYIYVFLFLASSFTCLLIKREKPRALAFHVRQGQ